ncbi:MAG: DUF4199 domain-containing protein [Saprospiraceae bacterium]|nr:DUF4199 domain-containing protein [Saprospiraceae bacterium]
MIKTSFFKSTFKQGVIMGLSFCLYTTLMWVAKLDTTYLSFGQYLDMAIIILPIIMILWAINQERNSYTITVIQRIVIAIFVGAISYLIYDPFLFVYHHYINSEWFNSVLSLKEIELKAANESPERILEILQKMKESNATQSGLFRLSTLVPSVFIIPTLIALISIVFIRGKIKQRKKYDFHVTVSTIFECSLERAFKTPMLCDVAKVHTGYGLMPRVTHTSNDENWGKPGSSKKSLRRKILFSKRRFCLR